MPYYTVTTCALNYSLLAVLLVEASDAGRDCKVEIECGSKTASVQVIARCPNAKEVAETLVRECEQQMAERSNSNYAWALSALPIYFLGGLGCLLGLALLALKYFGHGAMCLAIGAPLAALALVIVKYKPLVAFDSELQSSRDDRFKWIIRSLAVFVVGTLLLNAAFTAFRRQLFGW